MPKRLREGVASDQLTETEGERQLKRLLDQQLDKSVTLEEQFDRHRAFRSAVRYTPLTAELAGQMTVGKYREEEARKEKLDGLRLLGLNDDEIRLTFDQTLNPGLGKEPTALKDQLMAIEDKITNRNMEMSQASSFRDAKVLSRHEMELERSLKPNSQQAQLLMQLVTSPGVCSLQQGDPMNCLKEMEQELLERVKAVHRRKNYSNNRGNTSDKLPNTSSHVTRETVKSTEDVAGTTGMGEWRIVEQESEVIPRASSAHDGKMVVGKEDQVIVDYVVPVSDDEFNENRMTLDDIRQLKKFSDYEPGEPNNVLYIKNLAPNVTKTDLVALFGRYQQLVDLKFRQMTGKMRGQAFITFPDVDTASKALQFVNGFVWKGRPIIIQYGRQKIT